MAEPDQDIAVVGGGFGALSFLRRLVSVAPRGLAVTVCAGEGWTGRGLAYQTCDPRHLLNVRASRMGVDADDPVGFARWLSDRAEVAEPDQAFQPRNLYGRYLDACWDELMDRAGRMGVRLKVVTAQAERMSADAAQVCFELSGGGEIVARAVLISPGQQPPRPLAPDGPRWISSLWPDGAARLGELSGTIVVVGTGLTAVDAALTLLAQPGVERVVLVSDDGQLPRPHLLPTPHPGPAFEGPFSPRELVRSVRRRCGEEPWQAVFDRLRLDVPGIWAGWSAGDRAQCQRHLARWWAPRRNRAAPDALAQLAAAEADGRLVRKVGRIGEVEISPTGVRLSGATVAITADAGVDGRGLARIDGRGATLLDRAVQEGGLRLSPLGLGIAADPSHRASAPDMAPVHVIGAPRWGDLVETTGATEVRIQAATAADSLASWLGSSCA